MDAIMISRLDAEVAKLPAERRAKGVVVVMHQMGSHGPAYARRAPSNQKPFQPECKSITLSDCPPEQLVNAYDNSIAYTDHFLVRAIRWLQAQEQAADTALLYVSDHGESLGEGNLYLHGMPYALAPDVQKRVPWITWASAGLRSRTGLSMDCLREHRDQATSHDNYFHAVLGWMQVKTSAYQAALDPYASCRQPASEGAGE